MLPLKYNARLRHFLARKLLHVVFGTIFLMFFYVGYNLFGIEPTMITAFGVLVIIIILDTIRIEDKFGFRKVVEHLVKGKETDHYHALTYAALIGVMMFAVFRFQIAFTVMAISIYGDVSAAVIGKLFGNYRIRFTQKTLEGSIAYFIVGFIIGLVLFPFWVAALIAVIAAFIELFSSKAEDNFIIPPVIGLISYLLLLVL